MILNLHTQIRILREQYSYLRNDVLANRAFCAVACGKLPHHASAHPRHKKYPGSCHFQAVTGEF